MRLHAFLFSLLLVALGVNGQTTYTAADLTENAVTNAIASAARGDTVALPAGTGYWTHQITISRNINFAGAGTNLTIIYDEVPKQSPEKACLLISTEDTGSFRMTGIKFIGGVTNVLETFQGRIRLDGNCHSARIDHCEFYGLHGADIYTHGFIHGVIDNCYFYLGDGHPVAVDHNSWQPYNGAIPSGGGLYKKGHGSWADDAYWGTDKFLYIESCRFNSDAGIDAFEGARYVFRFNTITNMGVGNHGTEGQGRGGKQIEEYGNTFVGTSSGPAALVRSGTMLTFSNSYSGLYTKGHNLDVFRVTDWKNNWGAARGTNNYDDNVQHPVNGYWATGTHNGASNGSGNNLGNLIDTNAGWTVNQWLGTNGTFILVNMTKYASVTDQNDFPLSAILSNTSTNIPILDGSGANLRFDNGDTYQIWFVRHAIDQPGMGKDDGLMNNLPATPNTGWHNAATEMCYQWGGNTFRLESVEPCIVEGRDFTNGVAKSGYTPYTFPHPLTTVSDAPPSIPATPSPADAATGVNPSVTLTWTGTGASLYDLYLDTSNPPTTLVGPSLTVQSYGIASLNASTLYRWKVVARNLSYSTNGPVWSFTTAAATGSNSKSGNRKKK